ncbi:MAG: hypothetical protein LC664_08130, partial [Flavobacteriales bacterium]|nr:hypothetical protein [Flavobacteriales bacterium]
VIDPQITGPFSDVCQGEAICFDEWFCIDDCGDPLTQFELVLYEGFFTDCDGPPAGTIAEVITDQLPTPPYANCDPNTSVCSYGWIAEPGQYTLWIKAENNCGPDYECITIDIPFPDTTDITGDAEACLGESVTLEASLPGGSFSFTSCPETCPDEGNAAGEFTQTGTTLTWNTEVGANAPGIYEVEYGGACIGTGTFTVELFPLPEFTPTSNPGPVVCAEDQVVLDINYNGPNDIDACNWINLDTGLSISDPDCEVTVNPSPGINEYEVTVTDVNGCTASDNIIIEELTAPFSLDCSVLEPSYCNNVGAEIDLTDLLSPYPTSGTLTWELNGDPVAGTTIQLDGADDGSYTLEWTWVHGSAPNCVFSGDCSFDITPPAVPVLNTEAAFCAGEEVEISASVAGNIAGNWTFTSCPGTCPDDADLNDFNLVWQTAENTPEGTYTVQYSGDCLQTETIDFTIHPIPEFTITTDPGNAICVDDEITLGIDYTGSGTVAECLWVNENNGTAISPPDCEVSFAPTELNTEFSVTVTDQNGCVNNANTEIEIQTLHFSFDCDAIEDAYCDNEEVTIAFGDLVDIDPNEPGLVWLLDGSPLTGTSLDIEPLDASPDPYVLSYEYTAPTAPNCSFSGECSFLVSPLTTPTIAVNSPVCAGGEVTAVISGTNGFAGTWEFTDCPDNDCPDDFSNQPSALTWQTNGDTPAGDYEISYSGNCLETVFASITINPNPEISITTDPGETLCSDDALTLGVSYTGAGSINCIWENLSTGEILPSSDCETELTAVNSTETFAVSVTDQNLCASADTIEVSVQTQPFNFECPDILSYCENEAAVINFDDLVDTDPGAAGFSWFIDDAPIPGESLDIGALSASPDPYVLSFVYNHPEPPNCVFEDSCSFEISE